MARIPDDELARLKREVKLADLCGGYGIELKPRGADLVGLCPFHDDHEPSFVVTPSKNLWNCLGACGGGGDNIELVMKKEGVSFRHAVEILQRRAGRAPATPVVKTRSGKEQPVLAPLDASDAALLTQVVEFYHQTFLNDPPAMQYLQRRRCLHPEAIKTFKLGYANRTLAYRLLPGETAAARAQRAQLQRLGILRESGHEHLNGSIVIPIFSATGEMVQMYGRKIVRNLREGTPDHLYLPGPLRGVFNGAAISQQKEWLICEALIDALTLWSHGFRNVTAAYGVNGFTDDHWALLRACRPARVVICFDNDEAGNRAAEELAERLAAEGVAVWRAALPTGKDVNDVARLAKNPTTALAAVLEGATLMQGNDSLTALAVPVTEPAVTEETTLRADEVVSSLAAGAAKEETPAPATTTPCPNSIPCDTKSLNIPTKQRGEDVEITLGDRRYRVRGLSKNLSFELLKVNVRVSQGDVPSGSDKFYLDTLDLYNARQRQQFCSAAAEELQAQPDTIKKDLGKVLLQLEALQEQQLRQTLEPPPKEISMTEAERAAALELLRDPQLLDRILADFERCGVVGETTNKLVGYLAAVSRKLDAPLAVILQSTSAAGKSSLMEAVLAFMPEEDRIKYSAMTGQALFYLGETDLRHKILAIVEEEGAERASYALKLLQSEGELTIASTGKDPVSGRLITHEYHVEGPVMIFLTTTAVEIDEELLNRFLVLTVDEGREQTRAIHRLQRERETLAGLLARAERNDVLAVHRNAQRLLRPLPVVNPFAHALTFLDDRTRLRRDHTKYLALIRSMALLHQYQRPLKSAPHRGKTLSYLEVTLDDIATANRLAHEVLGRSLDELPPQTRRLLLLLDEFARAECERRQVDRVDWRFSRRDVRERTGWGDTQLKIHLQRLTDLEYLLLHRGGRGQSFVYELLYDGQGKDGKPFAMGLLDVESLRTAYDVERSGQNGGWSGVGRPPVGVPVNSTSSHVPSNSC